MLNLSFKQFINEADDQVKGAFKDFPADQQPNRIPSSKIRYLETAIKNAYGKLGMMFIPDALKKANKSDHGDLDVIIAPTKPNWVDYIKSDPYTVAYTKNGGQHMIVSKILGDGNQYMIDFISTDKDRFETAEFYYKFGPGIAVTLGSFAKSLGYKWGINGLSWPFFDMRKNLHNVVLTKDLLKTLKILMLDESELNKENLYEPKNVANWISASPRFDSQVWKSRKGFSSDTHKAARERPEVQQIFEILDSVNKKASISNVDFEIERKILGNDIIDKLQNEIDSQIQKSRQVLTGSEIIQLLGIKPGPKVGEYIQYLNNHPAFVNLSQDQLDTASSKYHARQILLNYAKSQL